MLQQAVGGLRLRSCSGGGGATCDEAAAVAGPSSLARAEVPQLLLGLQPPNQTSARPREARQAAASLWWRDPARRGLPAGGTFAL